MSCRFTDEFEKQISALGIEKGSNVLISSDLSAMLFAAVRDGSVNLKAGKVAQDKFLNDFIECLQHLVGSSGTLLVPAFTWEFCKGIPFDIKKSPSKVGSLGNWIIKNRPDFLRTKHALYSFMVWGANQDYLLSLENRDSFSEDSPFAFLHKNRGYSLGINISLPNSFTFIHYVEECLKVPYRYLKEFKGEYTDKSGVTTERIYSMFVRDLALKHHLLLNKDFFIETGALKEHFWNHQHILLMDLAECFEVSKRDLLSNNGSNIVSFDNYVLNWEKGPTHSDHLV